MARHRASRSRFRESREGKASAEAVEAVVAATKLEQSPVTQWSEANGKRAERRHQCAGAAGVVDYFLFEGERGEGAKEIAEAGGEEARAAEEPAEEATMTLPRALCVL